MFLRHVNDDCALSVKIPFVLREKQLTKASYTRAARHFHFKKTPANGVAVKTVLCINMNGTGRYCTRMRGMKWVKKVGLLGLKINRMNAID